MTLRDMPSDFTECAAITTDWALKAKYSCGDSTLKRWRKEAGIPPPIASTTLKPTPDDFLEYAAIESYAQLMVRYSAGQHTVQRWRKEAGIKRKPTGRAVKFALPPDFAEIAGHHKSEFLEAKYRVSSATIRRWRKETGVYYSPDRIPVPADFYRYAALETNEALRRRYGGSWNTVRRWRAEVGIEYIRPAREAPKRSHRVWQYTGPPAPLAPARDTSIEGQAAETLRAYAPTYRCDDRGRQNRDGEFWRYGNALLSPSEMFERASAKGWQPGM